MRKIALVTLLCAALVLSACNTTSNNDSVTESTVNINDALNNPDSIPNSEISELIDAYLAFEFLTEQASDSMKVDYDQSYTDGLYYYHKVTDDRYDTWTEWTEYVGSIFTGDYLTRILNTKEVFINVDGYTYWQSSAMGWYIEDGYTYETSDISSDKMTLRIIRTESVPEEEENIITTNFELCMTDGGWRICGLAAPKDIEITVKKAYTLEKAYEAYVNDGKHNADVTLHRVNFENNPELTAAVNEIIYDPYLEYYENYTQSTVYDYNYRCIENMIYENDYYLSIATLSYSAGTYISFPSITHAVVDLHNQRILSNDEVLQIFTTSESQLINKIENLLPALLPDGPYMTVGDLAGAYINENGHLIAIFTSKSMLDVQTLLYYNVHQKALSYHPLAKNFDELEATFWTKPKDYKYDKEKIDAYHHNARMQTDHVWRKWVEAEMDSVTLNDKVYKISQALIEGDIDDFAWHCGVEAKVYKSFESINISGFEFGKKEYTAVDDPAVTRTYPMLTIWVSESENDFFPVGEHSIIFDEGINVTFHKAEDFKFYARSFPSFSDAQAYVNDLRYSDFTITNDAYKKYDFILARLDSLAGEYNKAWSEDEIRAYAQKYLDTAIDVEILKKTTFSGNDGYSRIARGGSADLRTYLSEEIRDGITVVTAVFWADYSQIIPARKVEFHLELLDGEYKPIKAVVLEDNGFNTVFYST